MAKTTARKSQTRGKKRRTTSKNDLAKQQSAKKAKPKKKPARKKSDTTKKKTVKRRKKSKAPKGKKSSGKRKPLGRAKKAVKPPPYYEDMEELRRDRAENWPKLSKQRKKAEEVLEKYRKRLRRRKDVTGLHVALKRKKGKIARPLKYVLCIHVKKKPGKGEKQPANPIDRKIDGVYTDVIEMSYRDLNNNAPPPDRVFATLQGGVAISRKKTPGDFGTLGMIVHHFGQPVLLTNQHVAGKKGDVMRQPPLDDKLEFQGQEIIGKTFAVGAVEDCAIIEPNATRAIEQQIFDLPAQPDAFIDGELDEEDVHTTTVFKIGARTGLTEGTVEAVGADVHIPGQRTFHGQILVKGSPGTDVVEGGDSGSVLLKKEDRDIGVVYRVVGLVHAETEGEKFLVATPFRDVKKALEIRLHSRFS